MINCINYFSLKINYDQDFCSNVEVMQSHCFLIDQGYDATPLFSDLLLQTNLPLKGRLIYTLIKLFTKKIINVSCLDGYGGLY